MINNQLVHITLIILGILTLIFTVFPNFDIIVSSFFYKNELGFQYKNSFFAQFFFRAIPILTKIFTALCLLYMFYNLIKYKNFKSFLQSTAFFLFITISIGPGLIVNTALKENFGRARPSKIEQFSGDKKFSRAFEISDQCNTNCSFSSGHAATGFYFTALAYVFGAAYFSRIYLLGLLFGTMTGLSRIIMGGHFASDVLASAFIVLFLNHIIYILWKRKNSK